MSSSAWEAAFGRELLAYADERVRPWSAVAVAEATLIEAGRRSTPARPRIWVTVRLALAAVVVTGAVAAGVILGGAPSPSPVPSNAPSASPVVTSAPLPADLSIGHYWRLDFAASGISDEPPPGLPFRLSMRLRFSPSFDNGTWGYSSVMGHGGSSRTAFLSGAYRVDANHIEFEFDRLTKEKVFEGVDADIKARLSSVRTYSVHPCAIQSGPPGLATDGCSAELDLYDVAGNLVLAFLEEQS